jgi:glycosyltransferase involved in cell wall biosynthesis
VKTGSPLKLAVLCTHPIQYYAPVFGELASRSEVELKVFYGWRGPGETIDKGFGIPVQWDIPLLEGYDCEFVPNDSKDIGSHHFGGVRLPSLIQRIEEWRADAVLVYGWCYHAHLKCMRYFKGKLPVFFRGDSTLISHPSGLKGLARRLFLTWVYRHVDYALYVGARNRAYFASMGLSDSKLIFAPHAVDNRRFERPDADSQAQRIRDSFGLIDKDVLVVLPAKLEPIKNPFLLLEAFANLKTDHCHLAFAGSGPLETELKATRTPQTHFLGFRNQSEMPSVYCAADLVVLPSKSETWGLALNEAMACGRAVLASDRVGAACDLIVQGRNGWTVRVNDLDDLTRALREAVDLGRPTLHQMGIESREIISDWSISIQADAIVSAVCHAACKT